jgi:hypothetical protein
MKLRKEHLLCRLFEVPNHYRHLLSLGWYRLPQQQRLYLHLQKKRQTGD